jgi:hypothetical protein
MPDETAAPSSLLRTPIRGRPTAPDLYVGYEIALSVRPIVLGRIGFTKTQFVTGRVWFNSVAKKDRAA